MSEPDGNASRNVEPTSAEAEREIVRLSRRSFTTGGIAALAGGAGLGFLYAAPRDDGISWPLRRMLQFNERASETLLGTGRPAPTFDRKLAREPRVNGRLGLRNEIDSAQWRLNVLGDDHRAAHEHPLPIAAIFQLPRHEYVMEFKCVEGWSQIVHWAGARLADFCAKFGHDAPYIALATPDEQYYVGLDRASALHPQTLLAYEMNGLPLTPGHGAPLRLVCPLKYGVKSIKRIGSIRFASTRPADYWAERGYDWYLGH